MTALEPRTRDYLDHMIEAIELARSFTEGMAKADSSRCDLLQTRSYS